MWVKPKPTIETPTILSGLTYNVTPVYQRNPWLPFLSGARGPPTCHSTQAAAARGGAVGAGPARRGGSGAEQREISASGGFGGLSPSNVNPGFK